MASGLQCWLPDSPPEPVWAALFRPTGGCLGSCDGCRAVGLHTGGPSSAHSVTPLTTLLSLSDPVTKAESDRYRRGGESARKRERDRESGWHILLDTGVAAILA